MGNGNRIADVRRLERVIISRSEDVDGGVDLDLLVGGTDRTVRLELESFRVTFGPGQLKEFVDGGGQVVTQGHTLTWFQVRKVLALDRQDSEPAIYMVVGQHFWDALTLALIGET